MENRVNKKMDDYIQNLKKDVCSKINGDEFTSKNDLIKYIYDYENFKLSTEDINKRQRNKTTICSSERCRAKRSIGEQCSRRKRKDCNYCGTHEKGQPHGVIDGLLNDEDKSELLLQNNTDTNDEIKVDVYTEEINGVIYFKDKDGKYYNTDDVMMGKKNPAIMKNYEKKI